MARLYLTHNNKDVAVARRVVAGLSGLGHLVSLDINFLVPGEEWKRVIREVSAAADGLVALLSENSVQEYSNVVSSQWVASDIGAARASGKFIIPVILGKKIHIPALIDDLFAIRVESTEDHDIATIVRQIDEATRAHIAKKKEEAGLYLPIGYENLASSVRRYREDASYDESVFVMMKYPDPNAMEDKHCRLLTNIWETVALVLASYNLKARRADKKTYHEQLWENVCVYMLGSRYGMAILEDCVEQELNPNIALEYGFMKALNRTVALFRELNFKHHRADLTGKLAKPFEIDASGELKKDTLTNAIKDWLLDLGIVPRERL